MIVPIEKHEDGLRGRSKERIALNRLLTDLRGGRSRALVLKGEPVIGKTALLDYLARAARGCRVLRVAGVESEVELPFAGLHQLCAPTLTRVDALSAPQRDALRTIFGLVTGDPPDRFMVGLAALGLLSETAEDLLLLCIVDDAQWLDQVSAEALAFVGRRLLAERVGLVFALRDADGRQAAALTGVEELKVGGLTEDDAHALLDSVIRGPVDEMPTITGHRQRHAAPHPVPG